MRQKLMGLMRDESIETTLKFYVGRNADDTTTYCGKPTSSPAVNSLLTALKFRLSPTARTRFKPS